jgi:hypothetical protein
MRVKRVVRRLLAAHFLSVMCYPDYSTVDGLHHPLPHIAMFTLSCSETVPE